MRPSTVLFAALVAYTVALHTVPEPPAARTYEPLPASSVVWPLITPPALTPPALEEVFTECRNADPCIIKNNLGGSVWAFGSAAKSMLAGERSLVVIDGLCASACAIFADRAGKKVCITRNANFQFHKARRYRPATIAGRSLYVVDAYLDPPHRPELLAWVAQQGGFPEQGMLKMPYAVAVKFWRTCELDPPLPRPRPLLWDANAQPFSRAHAQERPAAQGMPGIPAHGLY